MHDQNAKLQAAIKSTLEEQNNNLPLNDQPITAALHDLVKRLDKLHGGFGGAPKFPQPTLLNFLLHKDKFAIQKSLNQMKNGGIYDQIGGGFFRYAVDAAWLIPHFEKMGYDNGQLLYLYAFAYHLFQDESYATIAQETAEWLLRDLQAPSHAFFASIDADSEGKEGKFYTFTPDELKDTLNQEEFELVVHHYNLLLPSNFEGDWHLSVTHPLQNAAEQKILTSAKQKLIAKRKKRIAPFRDEKILTAWNALIIKGLLAAGFYLKNTTYQLAAEKALNFLRKNLFVNNRLYAVYKDNITYQSAFLDDYAYLLDTLIYSLTIKWSTTHLLFAIELADQLLEHFADKAGGFFFTASDHEKLLYRPKNMMDDTMPAGNALATRALLILGNLLGETKYLHAAEKCLYAAAHLLQRFPSEHSTMLLALNDYLSSPTIVVLRGTIPDLSTWQVAANDNNFSFHRYVFAIPDTEQYLPQALAEKKYAGKPVAYICTGLHCLPPVMSINELEAKLETESETKS